MFAACTADIAVFSGQPGSGKTGSLILELGRWSHIPHYSGIAFRRLARDLVGAGSLWDLAKRWWPHTGARLPEHTAYWDSTNASVAFDHLQFESDVTAHDGHEYALICFDELPHFEQSQFEYLTYTRNRSTCGVKPYVRASTMAAPDSWVHDLVRPWLQRDGWPDFEQSGRLRWFLRDPFTDSLVWFDTEPDALEHARALRRADPSWNGIPKSFTVIHSVTADNAILTAANPEYAAGFSNLSREERLRKLGNWEARPKSSGMFDRTWFRALDSVDKTQIEYSVRGWDKASTLPNDTDASSPNADPDWTRGVRLDKLRNGLVVVSDVVSIRDRPGKVDELCKRIAEHDGPHVTQAYWRDPAQAGDVDETHTRQVLAAVRGCGPVEFVQARKDKVAYAQPVASWADPSTPGPGMAVVRAMWNGPFFAELEVFPLDKSPAGTAYKRDQVDALSRAWIAVETRAERKGGWLDAMRRVDL